MSTQSPISLPPTLRSDLLRACLLALSLALPFAVAGPSAAQEPSAKSDAAKPDAGKPDASKADASKTDASKTEAGAAEPSPDTVVAKVNGTPITQGDLSMAANDPALSLSEIDERAKRGMLIGYLVDLKVGAQAAEKAGTADQPEFKSKLAYLRDKLLLDEYLGEEAKKAVTPEAAHALYEQTAKAMKPEEEAHARHILVKDEALAKKVAARVKGGEDFAKVASEVSADPGSKANGGDLGWFTKEQMIAPFSEAAFKLKPGEISDPVKTQFGWHVIKLEEKRTKPVPSFDELKDQVEQYLTRKAQQDIILKLREAAKIEHTSAAPTAPPPPSPEPESAPKK